MRQVSVVIDRGRKRVEKVHTHTHTHTRTRTHTPRALPFHDQFHGLIIGQNIPNPITSQNQEGGVPTGIKRGLSDVWVSGHEILEATGEVTETKKKNLSWGNCVVRADRETERQMNE